MGICKFCDYETLTLNYETIEDESQGGRVILIPSNTLEYCIEWISEGSSTEFEGDCIFSCPNCEKILFMNEREAIEFLSGEPDIKNQERL